MPLLKSNKAEQFFMYRFEVKNIDCAMCAARIEQGLKAVDGVEDAVLDFAAMTLHVKARDPEQIPRAVHQIEPGVELVPKVIDERSGAAAEDTRRARRELVILIVSVTLFVLHFFWSEWFQAGLLARSHLVLIIAGYFLSGWHVWLGAYRTIRRGMFFDENVLMVIATVGALAIGAYAEALGVMIFYKAGELLQQKALSRSRRSIQALLAARPDKANLITDDGLLEVAPQSVAIGRQIMVRPGEKIPLDGEVVEGNSQLDSSALSGESLPVAVTPGSPVMAGQINKTGALRIRVTKLFGDSSIAKVLELVENATARKARTEKFITTFARYYTPAVVLLAVCIMAVPPLLTDAEFKTWLYRALVLLVISCPCALVVSIPLGYFAGIGKASRQGILVKGSNFIDALSAIDTVVFDKTGTLTKGIFEVKEVVAVNGFAEGQLLEFAAAAEHQSTHPIAASILAAFARRSGKLDVGKISDHINIGGKGVKVRYGDRTIIVGSDDLLHQEAIAHGRCHFDDTIAHIAVDGRYAGYVIIGDEIRPDARTAVHRLRTQGVKEVVMLTGDSSCPAQAVSKQLGLDRYYAGLLPEDKVHRLEKIQNRIRGNGKVAFIGDGINDAPVIARADVGIAMGAMGSDAAIETADVVLMKDSPAKLADAVAIAKQTRSIVSQNIVFVFVIKAIFIGLGAMGLASMWEAVFADMGTALIALVNATRILGKKALWSGISPDFDISK